MTSQPKWLSDLIDALDEITDDETTGIALIASSADEIKVRAFGDANNLAADVKAASEML